MTHRRTVLAVLAALLFAPAAHAGAAEPLACTILLDARDGTTLAHEGRCDVRITPASTFKIAIALMGYDSGVLADEHHPVLPFRPGYVDWRDAWRAPTDPARWIRESVVWYSQQTVKKLGTARWQAYVDRFGYGNRDLSDTRHRAEFAADGLSLAWVNSSLQISGDEQAAFLRKVVNRELAVSQQAYDVTARLLKVDAAPNGWEVHGKTGTAPVRLANGRADRDNNIGWFVGWTVRDGRKLVFARLMQHPVTSESYAGLKTREAFLGELAQRSL